MIIISAKGNSIKSQIYQCLSLMWFYHYMRQLKRWNFNATHHITIIWRAISNQTPIRFLQIASEKNGLKMRSKIFMTPCYLVLSQNSKPVIIEKTKKRQTFDTQSHSIWFGDQLSYDNLNYLAKIFLPFCWYLWELYCLTMFF